MQVRSARAYMYSPVVLENPPSGKGVFMSWPARSIGCQHEERDDLPPLPPPIIDSQAEIENCAKGLLLFRQSVQKMQQRRLLMLRLSVMYCTKRGFAVSMHAGKPLASCSCLGSADTSGVQVGNGLMTAPNAPVIRSNYPKHCAIPDHAQRGDDLIQTIDEGDLTHSPTLVHRSLPNMIMHPLRRSAAPKEGNMEISM